MKPIYHQAIRKLAPNLSFKIEGDNYDTLISINGESVPTEADIQAKVIELQADYDSKQYQRDRLQEYPSIQELVVALYDEEDKASIIEKRNAVKAKYPKPE